MIFLDKINEIKTKLEEMGHYVYAPSFTKKEIETGANTFMDYVDAHGGVEKVLPDNEIWKIKEEAIRGYKKIMDNMDVLLVCNFDKGEKKNRIGDNTFLEMGYMFFVGKKFLCPSRTTVW